MTTENTIPEKFSSIMIDFVNDLNRTFPEYKSKWWVYSEDTTPEGWVDLYNYCLTIYPERFFDILYQNEELFSSTSMHNTNFLPNVEFKLLFTTEGVSENTKTVLWKYLQLILFTVIGNVKDKQAFGDATNLFEGVNEEELQSKLTEAMGSLGDFFKNMESTSSSTDTDADDEDLSDENIKKAQDAMNDLFEKMGTAMNGDGDGDGDDNNDKNGENTSEKQENSNSSNGYQNSMPNPDDLHNHLRGLFGGKLGSLAQELVDELGGDIESTLGINANDFGENAAPTDILKKLMRNPDKIMKLVQKVQGKFQDKMNSGDLSQEDLMKDAGDMLRKMKEMGGGSNQMHEMFQNLAKTMGGSGGFGKNMKMDTGKLDRMMKTQDTKDRMRAKLEKRKQEQTFKLENNNTTNQLVYRPDGAEKAEKTTITEAQLEELSKDFASLETDKQNQNKPSTKKKSSKKKKKAK